MKLGEKQVAVQEAQGTAHNISAKFQSSEFYEFAKFLRPEQRSTFEERVKLILDTINDRYGTHIVYDEQVQIHYTSEGIARIYTPDFVIRSPLYQNDVILLEPHGGDYFDDKFIAKMYRFTHSQEYKDAKYHLVIISELSREEVGRRIEAYNRRSGYRVNGIQDLCAEYITDPRTDMESPDFEKEEKTKLYYKEALELKEELNAKAGGTYGYDDIELIRRILQMAHDEALYGSMLAAKLMKR